MPRPQIDWDWRHLPSPRDEVSPIGVEKFGEDELCIFYSHTERKFLFEFDGAYGVLVKGVE